MWWTVFVLMFVVFKLLDPSTLNPPAYFVNN